MIKISGYITEMADDEIKSAIPENIYDKIKEKDPHPHFKAYIIGHEGDSTGKFNGIHRIKEWVGGVIREMYEKLKYGTSIFFNSDNPHDENGRKKIGEVVGKVLKTIKDKLSTIAITYIFPEYTNIKADIASIEADAGFHEYENKLKAISINKITGIAVGDSAKNQPGFPGATLQACVQEMAKELSEEKNMELTLEDLKNAIKEGSYKITDIFSKEEIQELDFVRESADGVNSWRNKQKAEYERRMRVEKALDDYKREVSGWEEKKQEIEGENAKLKKQIIKIDAYPIFKDQMKKRKIDDATSNFIEKFWEQFDPPDNKEYVSYKVDKFIDEKIEQINEFKKSFPMQPKDDDGDDDDEPKKDSILGNGGEKDLGNPVDNPLIPAEDLPKA